MYGGVHLEIVSAQAGVTTQLGNLRLRLQAKLGRRQSLQTPAGRSLQESKFSVHLHDIPESVKPLLHRLNAISHGRLIYSPAEEGTVLGDKAEEIEAHVYMPTAALAVLIDLIKTHGRTLSLGVKLEGENVGYGCDHHSTVWDVAASPQVDITEVTVDVPLLAHPE